MSNSTDSTGFDNVEASTTSNVPVQVTNALSLTACLALIVSYFLFRRKNRRLMGRTSLVLAVSMACTDGLLHCINLFGYTDLPHNFICSFFGGFLYAFPTLISIFYSVCIALNTQLVFVFSKRPGTSTLKYYVGVPIILSLVICVPALATNTYGYDASWDLCWYATEGRTPNEVLIRYLFTFGLWCLAAVLYLVVAAATIIFAVFSKSSRMNHLAQNVSDNLNSSGPSTTSYGSTEKKRVSFLPEISETGTLHYTNGDLPSPYSLRTGATQRLEAKLAQRQQRATLSRRSLAMRALSFRLLGYIMIPTICILPGVVKDLVSKVNPDAINNLPDWASTMFDSLNGLVGLLNAILYAIDPALLAMYHQLRTERLERKVERLDATTQDVEMGHQHSCYNVVETQASLTDSGDLAVGTQSVEKVEVRPGRFLNSILIAENPLKGRKPLGSPNSPGIVIKVEVQVSNDLDRLEDFLGGL